jgi:hypothetical protein
MLKLTPCGVGVAPRGELRPGRVLGMVYLNPAFSPVIYCGAKYAAIFAVFLNSLNQHSTDYASFAQSAKTANLTTSSAPRDENW